MRITDLAGQGRKIFPVLFGILLLHLCAVAQDLPAAKPESVGLSSDRLDRIANVVQHDIDDKRIAGAVTLVVRRGHVAWFKAQGMIDREANKPMPTDAMFRICSMSKPITSVAVMMLYEEGKFLLDDPVSIYLPEFKNPKVLVVNAPGSSRSPTSLVPAGREITPTQRSSVSRSPARSASYSGRPFVSSASGPSATAPSVWAVGTGGSAHGARRAGRSSRSTSHDRGDQSCRRRSRRACSPSRRRR